MCKSHHKEEVEDLVQETFLKAHKVSNWNEVKNPEAFLVRIASNAYKDHLRKERRNIADGAEDISQADIEGDLPTPEQILSRMQEIKKLEKAINSLSPRVRQAIILIKILNISYKEAGEIMNISVSTIESHVKKGMVDCKVELERQSLDLGKDASAKKIISFSEHKSARKVKPY